ncbi:MAG TPA: NAD(P)H-hydrate dehydratase [Xanthomonadales bacterium]|nr:NAD(P)H-hydrate dehydratase [Xanthomonadales bacterium]
MQIFNKIELKKLYIPPSNSHKGQNGKMMLIGGSHLFHAASLWALTIASKFVDMVFYSSVPENNEIVAEAKKEFRNGIVVPRGKIDNYIGEADCILIGPGLPRPDGQETGDDDTKELTEKLFKKFPDKKWVIDGGSLQVINPKVLSKKTIVTPHKSEFEKLFGVDANPQNVEKMAKKFGIIILLKGEKDIVCSPVECMEIKGGNAGMTKGGTGDVLAGLVASLACKNNLFLAATAGSYINKKAGESLFKKVGYNFNASDLADEIPAVMKILLP